jgi:hypothetical protein
MMGVLLLFAAFYSNGRDAKGFAGALNAIQAQTNGAWLVGIMALGLMAFGLYGVVEGAYRRVKAPSLQEAAAGTQMKWCKRMRVFLNLTTGLSRSREGKESPCRRR